MEEKKAIKVSLGTVIFIVIIAILVIGLGIMYYLGFVKNKAEYEQKISNLEANIPQNEKISNEILENTKTDKSIALEGNQNVSKEQSKTIILNGNSHKIVFKHNVSDSISQQDLFQDEIEIIFDNKLVKTYSTYQHSTEEEIESFVIIGKDNQQYLMIKVKTYALTSCTEYYTFFNEKGEIIGIIDWDNATGGKYLTSEITSDGVKYGKATYLDKEVPTNCAVVVYQATVQNDKLSIEIIETYNYQELGENWGAGAWR